MKKMSLRSWVSIVTLLLVGVIVFLARKELYHAWQLLGGVDWWILALIIPVAMLGYLTAGEMIFSYLRQKKSIKHINLFTQMRISLELNFVNHVLPSGGVSGVSYMNWRLKKLGIATGKATMAQVVRYVSGFAAMITLLIVAVFIVTIDGTVNRWIILMSSTLVSVMIIVTIGCMFLFSSKTRMRKVSSWLARLVNTVVRKVTFGKKETLLRPDVINDFLEDMHDDYVELMKDKRILIQPYSWGIVFTITEIALFWIVFWALGSPVNPAPILIAYGLASLAGFLVVTPGGAGAYEAIMVFVLAISGMSSGEAIAGIVLTRAIILFITIVAGWVFYQEAVLKYGKQPNAAV